MTSLQRVNNCSTDKGSHNLVNKGFTLKFFTLCVLYTRKFYCQFKRTTGTNAFKKINLAS